MPNIKTVPHQRVISIHKEICDTNNRYTTNNLCALDQAAFRLQSKGGFKLYMYLAKNQNKYNFALSSSDFCAWSGLGLAAYRSAFAELEANGFLIPKESGSNIYIFYDKPQIEDQNSIDNVMIEAAGNNRIFRF
jgi:hypothetical protein